MTDNIKDTRVWLMLCTGVFFYFGKFKKVLDIPLIKWYYNIRKRK